MADEGTLRAATAIVRGFARNSATPYQPTEFKLQTKDTVTSSKISLPGVKNAAKDSLEDELVALAARIKYLEDKASTVNNQMLPDTPSELGEPTSPFPNGSPSAARNGVTRPSRKLSGSKRQNHISNLLTSGSLTFSEEDMHDLRDHVEKQADEIRSQKDTVDHVKEQLLEQKEHAKHTLTQVGDAQINLLERELLKHQQANEAFQKALKEIGTIITNVANGDLSQKVQIHAVEMDPEIATFKRTINTMMDQLQVFGNEVSRVAREVGTEGILGGQAQISGVSGIWKNLTDNGAQYWTISFLKVSVLTVTQSTAWPTILLCKFGRLQTLLLRSLKVNWSARSRDKQEGRSLNCKGRLTLWWINCVLLPPKLPESPGMWVLRVS